ncbi:unnamed protein product [Brassica rapa subsp. narinosa]
MSLWQDKQRPSQRWRRFQSRMLWIHSLNLSVAAPPLGPPPAPRLWLASECAASEPFPPVTVVSAANAPTGPVYRKVWYNHLILPYYHLVRLKLTLEKSWDYDQHFHANMILDSKRKDNSFKTGKNNDNRSYDY